jgi:flavin reductase
MVEQIAFREALARLGAAVNAITTDGEAGRYGIIASAVCSVTDTPPTILACVNRLSAANEKLKANGVLCVNVLASAHRPLSEQLANGALSIDERFGTPDRWTTLATGSPVLGDASVAIDCRITSISEVGTHSVFFCEVVAIRMGAEKDALMYFDRAYHGLAALASGAV